MSKTKLLDEIDEAFDRDHIEERWSPHGYTIDNACKVATAYEKWAGECLSFVDVDEAICGTNDSGGLFPERTLAFFAARRGIESKPAIVTVCEIDGMQIIVGAKDATTLMDFVAKRLRGSHFDPTRFQAVTIMKAE